MSQDVPPGYMFPPSSDEKLYQVQSEYLNKAAAVLQSVSVFPEESRLEALRMVLKLPSICSVNPGPGSVDGGNDEEVDRQVASDSGAVQAVDGGYTTMHGLRNELGLTMTKSQMTTAAWAAVKQFRAKYGKEPMGDGRMKIYPGDFKAELTAILQKAAASE